MIPLDDPEFQFAVEAVRAACRVARSVQEGTSQGALSKDDRSPVTVADFAVQALVSRALEMQLPKASLVAEEDSSPLRKPGGEAALLEINRVLSALFPETTTEILLRWIDRTVPASGGDFWTLDPIDGTKGFLRGEQYAVALARIAGGEVQMGLLGCPALEGGSLVVAVRNRGCWKSSLASPADFAPVQVSRQTRVDRARVLRSVESSHTNSGQLDLLLEKMGVAADPVLMDSQAKYAVLAEGSGDLLFRLLSPKQPDYRERIWDQAAGALIIEEAGGRITDLDGRRLDFSAGSTLSGNRGVLASNGPLHETALGAIQALGV